MIRALLDGRKSQTRRVLKPQPPIAPNAGPFYRPHPTKAPHEWHCTLGGYIHNIQIVPYAPGDLLWVCEPLRLAEHPQIEDLYSLLYKADDAPVFGDHSIKTHELIARFMPRWASRLTLEVTDVRVQRVQEISEGDAWLEGIDQRLDALCRDDFRALWDSLNAKRGYGWDANPWVCAITFRVHRANVDDVLREAAHA